VAPAAPGYADFDVLQAVLTRAHARGLRVKAWVPQFHDQASVRAHPGWAMQALVAGRVVPYNGSRQNETFANPLDEEVQRYQLSVLREVASRYAVDGVMLDWIRFDDYPMDLGDATRARFKALSGVDPIEIDFKTESPLRARWNDFRTAEIARYIGQVRAALPSQMALGVYILPPDFVEVGQDAARFAADVVNQSYFGWDAQRFSSRAEHNWVRALGQLSLARSLSDQQRAAEAVTQRLFHARKPQQS
jgi:uncharacterized lipoprotein YddW (UPF0748 family)